ncbi:MAG: undecaprenyl-phosphate glucose phosphotransferase [Bacteroidota bacterium]
MKVRKQRIIFSYLLLELILLNLSFFFTAQIKYGQEVLTMLAKLLPLLAVFNISWIIGIIINGSHDYYLQNTLVKRLRDQFKILMILVGIASPIILLFFPYVSRFLVFGTFLMFFSLTFLGFWLSISWKWNKFGTDRSMIKGTRLLVVGAGAPGLRVHSFVERNKHLGFQMIGYLDDKTFHTPAGPVLGKIKDLSQVLDDVEVDEVVIALPGHHQEAINATIETADHWGVRVSLIPDFLESQAIFSQSATREVGGVPVIELRQTSLDSLPNYIMKKGFDLVFSTMALVGLMPVFAIIALAIYIDDRGPVFYKPARRGQGKVVFSCYKFRTMYVNFDSKLNNMSTQKDDPRITRVGKFLRKYSLDELPQFFNVLEGHMSVVGPRPHRVSLDEDMQQSVEKYMIRHYIKPGITGWAQVNGWRGPTETEEQRQQRFNHDFFYITNWSFWLDMRIVWKTVFDRKTHKNAF